MKIVYVLLSLALIRGILLYKTYRSIPILELKRRARQHDKKAVALYKVASYGPELYLRQWLFCTAVGSVLVIWSARTNWWLAAIVLVITSWLAVFARASADGWAGRLAVLFVPFDTWILLLLHPILGPISRLLITGSQTPKHSGLYDIKDLLDLLNRQNKQLDNRIQSSDLQIARGALTFGDKTVGSIMAPRKAIKFVQADEQIGPILVDELHKTGFTRFPVVKDSPRLASPRVVGTLYLNNLIGYDGSGKVKDLMKPEVYFINEDATLRQALSAFLKTHHHLLIVVNSFEETVGVISQEDVLEQIIGKPMADEFDAYENPRAVAAMKADPDNPTVAPKSE